MDNTNKKRIRSRSDAAFDSMNTVLVLIFVFICAYPIYYTIIASFSDPGLVINGKIYIIPRGLTLNSYQTILNYSSIFTGYKNTLIYMTFGTLYNLFLLIPASYAMSKKILRGRNVIMVIFVFTMYFSGGLIPYYLLLRSMNLLNHRLVMILPGAFSVYYMIITRTYFSTNFPDELAEAAKIDGAGEFRIFIQIALPLSGAIIAVMVLYHAVGHWNSYFNALLFVNKPTLYPLQLVLRQILNTTQYATDRIGDMSTQEAIELLRRRRLAETMKYSLIIIASLPVLVAYPFVQKYFVRGVLIGSVKG